jgi:hypothetical protein
MADHWFRLYDKIVHDVKVQALPGPLFKTWINILCIVSDHGECLPPLNAIAFALRVDEAAALVALTALRKAGLLDTDADGKIIPHNWAKRQFIAPKTVDGEATATPNAVKQKRHREKVKREKLAATAPVTAPVTPSVTAPVTEGNVTGNAKSPDTDTETDTDKGKGSREVALVPPDWPTDYFDQFWKKYPNKVDRAGSVKSLSKVAKKGGIEWSTIMTGLDVYNAKTDDRPWCNPTTWINQSRWDWRPPAGGNNGKAKTGGSIIDALRD